MSDVVVQVAETTTTVSVTDSSVNVNVVESPVQVSVGTSGPQGAGVPDGGSAGQFLAKASGTDYDTTWVDHVNTVIQEYVKNDGAALSKGQAVYVSGANGTNIIVSAADNGAEATSSKTIGLLLQSLAINEFGYVVTQGRISGLNTSAASAGDAVWLGTNGNLIYGLANKPAAPANLVYLGVVTRAHANQGEIFVNVQNGFELQELHNVSITSPATNQVLSYDSATSLWKNTAGTVAYASTSGTAVYATTAGSATPTAHAASHGSAGSDPVTVAMSQVTGLSAALASEANLTGGNTFTGNQIINTGGTATAGLTINSTTGQTAYPLEVLDGTGSRRFIVTEFGTTVVGGNTVFGGRLNVNASNATTIGQIIRLATSASANAFEVQNSAGTVLTNINSSGWLGVNNIMAAGGSTARMQLSGTTVGVNFPAPAATYTPIVVKGAASQSANLLEWQDSAGGQLGYILSSGSVYTSGRFIAGTDLGSKISAAAATATQIPLVLRGAASQTANLQEWQLSDGSVVLRVDSAGRLNSQTAVNLNNFSPGFAFLGVNAQQTIPAIIAKASAAQTADIVTYWNNSNTAIGGRNGNAQIYTGSTAPLTTSTGGTIQSIATGANPLVTMASAHNLAVGDRVTLAGTTGGTYNGSFIVATVPASTTFTITSALTTGQAGAGGTVAVDAQASIVSRSAATAALIVRAAASQAGSVLSVQNSAGTSVMSVDTFGYLQAVSASFGTSSGSNSLLLRLKPQSSVQLADQMQYQNSANTVLGGRNANAQIYTGSTAPLTTAVGGATTAASGDGTTATLTTTSNHNLAVGDRITVAGVTPTGYNGTFIVTAVTSTTVSYANATTGAQTVAGTVSVDAQASIVPRSNATAGLHIRMPSGYLAMPFRVEDSTSATVAYLTNSGIFEASTLRLPSTRFTIQQENSGGKTVYQRMTAASTNPGANYAALYFRDGTNAGTLKLVVRAGAAGAETTILDNIPQ